MKQHIDETTHIYKESESLTTLRVGETVEALVVTKLEREPTFFFFEQGEPILILLNNKISEYFVI